jgi:nucleotide-binding universal stress UspA family protein
MHVFRDLLAAIDDSPTAARALDTAGELAEALNARLTVIAVVPEVSSAAYRTGVDVERLRRDVERETEKLIRSSVERLPAQLPVTTILRHGDAGKRIVEQVEAGGHDLLVMGSRGRGRVAANLFGSVAGYVHFHARVAMLVIHPDDED